MTAFVALLILSLQAVYGPSDFVTVSGNSLRARYDAALAQGRRGDTDTFWIAYQFRPRSGVRLDRWDGSLNAGRVRNSDGIERIDDPSAVQQVGLFLLVRKADGAIDRTRLLDFDEMYRVRDRKVYWIGEPSGAESLAILSSLAASAPQRVSSTLTMAIALHPEPESVDSLLRLARGASSTQARKDAVFWLGQEVSRRAGEELEKMAGSDPEVEVQKQAVFAISQRRGDEAIPALLRIAKEHPNPAVRKQAIFWLGQKNDPRVLDTFEQLLKTK